MNAFDSEPAVILIVDEDPLTLTGVAAVLHLSGHECHCARGAEAAWKAVRSLDLDLILLNADAKSDGLRLCCELKKDPRSAEIPILLMSSDERPEIVREAHDAGATYYLRKPFDPDVLTELVEKALWLPHLVNHHIEHQRPAAPHVAPASVRSPRFAVVQRAEA